jgi:hypothetical protein
MGVVMTDRGGYVVVAYRRKYGKGSAGMYEHKPFYTSEEVYTNRKDAERVAVVKRQEFISRLNAGETL